MRLPVIVGFDGSPSAYAAIRFGVDEARRRGCELHLLHAFSWPLMYPMFAAKDAPTEQTPRTRMLDFLARTARDLRVDCPDVVVRWRLVDGSPGGVLTDASAGAGLMVVGHRGLGGFAGLLAGSVGLQAAGHSTCPVVVVRGEAGRVAAPIVVGVDGSPAARTAAAEAFVFARRRGVDLHVVHWQPPAAVHGGAEMTHHHGELPLLREGLGIGVHGAADGDGEAKYHLEVVRGDSAAAALTTAARELGAGLLVVGARGVGDVRGLIMGSTSRSLIEQAPCPVMVVPREVESVSA